MRKKMYSTNEGDTMAKNALISGHFIMAWWEWEQKKRIEYERRFDSLEEKIDELKNLFLGDEPNSQKVIVVKEMDYEDAKNLVISYFKEHKEADISELHEKLGIKIDMLIEIIDELKKKKIIG